jgi:hypothetical protein
MTNHNTVCRRGTERQNKISALARRMVGCKRTGRSRSDSVKAYVMRREDEINRLLDAYLAKTDDELAAMTF